MWQQIGIGIKNRNVAYSNITNKTFIDTSGDDEGPGGEFGMKSYIEEEGSDINFNVNLNLKLAYKF